MFKSIHKYNFYKYENTSKEDTQAFIKYLEDIFESKNLEVALDILKSSGKAVNIYNSAQSESFFKEVIRHFKEKVSFATEREAIQKLEFEVAAFEELFSELNSVKEAYFSQDKLAVNRYKVVSYLIALELYLRNPSSLHEDNLIKDLSIPEMGNLFEAAAESTGMMLNYFMYNKYEFKGRHRNISPKAISISSNHLIFSGVYKILTEILEYWKYSKVEVTKIDNDLVNFKVIDDSFETYHLVSNMRFQNLRDRWLVEIHGANEEDKALMEEEFGSLKSYASHTFAKHFFNSSDLTVEVKKIQLKEWIKAYEVLVKESQKFLQKNKNSQVFNLEKVCLVKSQYEWERLFLREGFSKKEIKTIIDLFTFKRTNQDLVDSPFIEIDNSLALVPTLTAHSDIARALSSNFINNRINMTFRGPGFENRIIEEIQNVDLPVGRLYKKVNGAEYECDIAFVLDNDLYLVECKAHLQPYSPRQHADYLNKVFKETSQLNRIADFFSENVDYVKEQLNIENHFEPRNIHRILITAAMTGSPLFAKDVYIIDESAFITFLQRTPPSLIYRDPKKNLTLNSNKFEVYEGDITSEKLIDFLKSPPSVEITKSLLKDYTTSSNLFQATLKLIDTHPIQFEQEIESFDWEQIKKHFN